MKKSDKKAWDKLIYGLIYPGFLGSMLYELIPTDSSKFTSEYFFATPDNYIRYGIILFYSLDYAHLYGDMDGLIKDPDKKNWVYFVVDILTCLSYVASFIALKIPDYWLTFFVFGLVPFSFLAYKWRNIADRKFLIPYGCVTFVILVYRLLCIKWGNLILLADRTLALLIVWLNVIVYWRYIGWYYEKSSRHLDAELYRDK
jgi:hypothetical protein